MKRFSFDGRDCLLREANDADVPRLRALINSAYRELWDLGMNYTGTYQDEEITRERLGKGRGFVLESDGELLATVLLSRKNEITGRDSAYISQLAVAPNLKKKGLGSLLMDHCEDLARNERIPCVQLDTAQPASHLVSWYLSRGYRIVGRKQWDGKTYASWIFERDL